MSDNKILSTPKKERVVLQSIVFLLDECINAFDALKELEGLRLKIGKMKIEERDSLILPAMTIHKLCGITRDQFCIRIANLFDKRKDVHSLKKYFKGNIIDTLEGHAVTKASIKARHSNIAHLSKAYVKWPEIDVILKSNIIEILETIQLGIIII
ncbi:MAG: hypothetical protein WCO09_03735 [bacterium]